ncbi:DUF3068 domain-containing protein [Actinocorallia sp. B10E7]|uniref:DUF3068 domain-containing protein n=1 Tax=Actinocorallia sp. B10E7 TaxID=3153558 RepID=UPI00325CEA7D
MKRGGFLLVMLGAFFLTMAPLTRFYIADRVIAAPLDFGENLTLAAEEASYYDVIRNKVRSGVELKASLNLGGDIKSSDDDLMVANGILELYSGKSLISLNEFRMAFDRRTGLLKNAKGSGVDRNTEITQTGYWMMLPIGNVQKETYQLFDLITGRTWPARFTGVEEVAGISAYRFEQHVEPTLVAHSKNKVAPSVVGLPDKAKPGKIDRYYESTNTLWVDPRTGMPIKLRQNVNSTLRTADGHEGVFVEADLVLDDKGVQALAKASAGYADTISMLRTTLPGVSLAVGLVLLAVGGVLSLLAGGRRRRGPKHGREVEQVPAGSNPYLAGNAQSK